MSDQFDPNQFDDIFFKVPPAGYPAVFTYKELAEFFRCSERKLRDADDKSLIRHKAGTEVIIFWPHAMRWVRNQCRFKPSPPISNKLLKEIEDEMLPSSTDDVSGAPEGDGHDENDD